MKLGLDKDSINELVDSDKDLLNLDTRIINVTADSTHVEKYTKSAGRISFFMDESFIRT